MTNKSSREAAGESKMRAGEQKPKNDGPRPAQRSSQRTQPMSRMMAGTGAMDNAAQTQGMVPPGLQPSGIGSDPMSGVPGPDGSGNGSPTGQGDPSQNIMQIVQAVLQEMTSQWQQMAQQAAQTGQQPPPQPTIQDAIQAVATMFGSQGGQGPAAQPGIPQPPPPNPGTGGPGGAMPTGLDLQALSGYGQGGGQIGGPQ